MPSLLSGRYSAVKVRKILYVTGNWYWFEGNFEQYQENRVARLGEDAAKPHRVHRKLTRD